jgi:Na+/H+ antiporter NhaC
MSDFDKATMGILAMILMILMIIMLWTLSAWHTEVQKMEKLAQAIESGVDPVKARCAFFGMSGRDDVMCAAVASNQGDKQ